MNANNTRINFFGLRVENIVEETFEQREERRLSIRRERHALKIAAREQAREQGLYGAAFANRVRRLYRDMLETTRAQRLVAA